MRFGGVVLCGGKSTRMGYPKALLPFGSETTLQRVTRLLGEVVAPIAVVASEGQALPALPNDAIVTHDRRAGRGPLEGLHAGLMTLQDACDAVYLTSCDAPRLAPAFVRRMTELLGDYQVAVPCDGAFCHPLAAVYRMDVLPLVEELLAEDRLRLGLLFERAATRRIAMEDLRSVDPDLATLANLNDPSDYLNALAAEGLAPPAGILEHWTRESPETPENSTRSQRVRRR